MQMRVDGKSNTYTVESPPESFVAFPKIVNFDFFRILGNCL